MASQPSLSGNTVGAPAPSALSSYIQPTLNHGLRIWWAFFWPTYLITVILAIALNLIIKLGYENLRIPASVASPILKYFAPLQKWLDEQNKGLKQGW